MKMFSRWLGCIVTASLMLCSASFARGEIDQIINGKRLHIRGGLRCGSLTDRTSKIEPGSQDVVIVNRKSAEDNCDDLEYPVAITANQYGVDGVGGSVDYFHGKSVAETLTALVKHHYPTFDPNTVENKLILKVLTKLVSQDFRFSIWKNASEQDGTPGLTHVFISRDRGYPRPDVKFDDSYFSFMSGEGDTFAEAMENALGMEKGEIASKQKFADDLLALVGKKEKCINPAINLALKDLAKNYDADVLNRVIQQSLGGTVCQDVGNQITQLAAQYISNRVSTERPAPNAHIFDSVKPVSNAGTAQ